MTEEYKELVSEIRLHRAKLSICPSAQEGVVISEILEKIIKDEVYRSDYEAITIDFLFSIIRLNIKKQFLQ